MKRLTFLGGHKDGEVWDDHGPDLVVPVPQPLTVYHPEADVLPPAGRFFPVERYRSQQDDDGRWWYVLVDSAY